MSSLAFRPRRSYSGSALQQQRRYPGLSMPQKLKLRQQLQAASRLAKRAKSRTKTVQKRTTPQVISNNGESKSSFALAKPLTSKMGKLLKEFTKNVTLNNFAARIECVDGLQETQILADYFTDTDVNSMFTLSASTPASVKIFLERVHGESLIKNQTDVTSRIKIYDVICRMTTDSVTTNPDTAFNLGFADLSGGAASDYKVPGASPFSNPRFVEYFKILNTTDVVLTPGATHLHQVDYKPNRLISHIQSNAIAGTGINGLTVYTYMVFYGSPINAVSTQSEVTTSAISLDIVSTEEYHYGYIHPSGGAASIVNSLDLALSSAGATMQVDGVELAFNEA